MTPANQPPAAPGRVEVAHTLRHQLEAIALLEAEIDRNRLNDSLERIMREADRELDIKRATHEGGQ